MVMLPINRSKIGSAKTWLPAIAIDLK